MLPIANRSLIRLSITLMSRLIRVTYGKIRSQQRTTRPSKRDRTTGTVLALVVYAIGVFDPSLTATEAMNEAVSESLQQEAQKVEKSIDSDDDDRKPAGPPRSPPSVTVPRTMMSEQRR